MNPLFLSKKDFIKSFKSVPRFAVNLLIVNHSNQFLLTKRNIPPEIGKWHLPGAFLMKNETIFNCQKRILKKELGISLIENVILVDNSENLDKDPRGHIIDSVYKVEVGDSFKPETTSESSDIKFFDKIPNHTGFNHVDLLRKLGYQ